MTPVFSGFRGYGFIHHRALNEPSTYKDALQLVSAYPARDHILEGDLSWDFRPGNELFYFRHPSYVVDTLSTAAILKGLKQGALVSLADLALAKDSPASLVVELKVGRGDAKAALHKLVDYLEANFAGRYWIDGFSLPMLEHVKRISPRTAVTLHTEYVSRGRVLIGAPEWPPVRIRKLSDLPLIDGVAIRWRGGEARMARSAADVRAANKVLILSRIHDLRQFECSKMWGASAGYVHWDFEELLALNDQLDKTRAAAGAR